ncbi:TetR/AcrR family transcriptional regulator [Aerococcaceae bacterium DSM 111176]|nr:TetR/AcrR family transcriptional regulator [Aerococcaceae bacterium DSM 111176]
MSLNKGNSKSQHSKEQMRNALLDLLREKDFDSITIQEITDKAELSRRTYYRNYRSKVDIVSDILQLKWQDYLVALKKLKPSTMSEITEILYGITMHHKEDILLLHKQNLLIHLIPIATNDLPNIMANRYPEMSIEPKALRYMSIFIVSGFFQVIPTWLTENPEISSTEMGQYLEKILLVYAPEQSEE